MRDKHPAVFIVKEFIKVNRRLAIHLERSWFPGAKYLFFQYPTYCLDLLCKSTKPLRVLDIGSGRQLAYASPLYADKGHTIIGCDIDEEEIKHNESLQDRIIADASESLPVPDGSIDLITSCFCLEHLPNVTQFFKESKRILADHGEMSIIFAGSNSLHALLNKALPTTLSRKIVHLLIPGSEHKQGFQAYYDKCSKKALEKLLNEDFEILRMEAGHYNYHYFRFLLPLFLIILLWDKTLAALQADNLAQSYYLHLRKRSS